ncbi:MAG TPA: hypothetical protein DDY58_05590 [Terrisporobacter glycolicus]|uniref:hypothetical protein n=1 Tax=Terrisporobacter TaxID=1505652 RepID=UPI000E97DAFC|nr:MULTISPECIES: hypothetical protein [Terrisporobacter]MBN9646242.1 hypothetical protein [Terrisporobacter glycolicus]UPA29294.1 hypothetical protein L0P85_11850 [Terrisporobacter glycolicus]HBI91938.1 hypothetical protein [Terrisporobacter hibernicus]
MKKNLSKDEILKAVRKQLYVCLVLLLIVFWGFLSLSNQINELNHDVTTMKHELDYAKGKIEELEKNK